MTEIRLDKLKVEYYFKQYTRRFNLNDPKIRLKADHTWRVALICRRIAEREGLSRADIDLAWLLGMLHDIGRFEQVKRYGTFKDADSIDHARFGEKLLFDDAEIKGYVSEAYLRAGDHETVIRTAVRNHSALRIEEGLSERMLMFCNILRDADKIDILKVNSELSLESIYNLTTEEIKQAVVSDAVMEQFLKGQIIVRSTKQTAADYVAGHAALVFEIVYPVSMQIIREQGYLKKIMSFQSDNPITREQFEKMRAYMKNYLKEMDTE